MPDRRNPPLVFTVVVLLLTGTVLPVAAIESVEDSPAPASHSAGSNASSMSSAQNASPLERKRAAIETVESMDVGWRFQWRQRDRTVDRLNGTLAAYRDDYRVSTSSVFRDDRRALRSLDAFAWTDPAATDRAAHLVVSADLETVNTSIDDARFVLRRTEGRIDDSRERRRAERAIHRANRARERALDALDDSGRHGRTTTTRRRALVHLGIAWTRSQRAIDVLDRASAPSVTIGTRSDPPRDGSEPVTRTIRGNVSAVRGYELGNVSVAVDGTEVGTAPVDASPAPGRNASFAVNVTLDGPVAEVSVSVTDADRWDRKPRGASPHGRWHWFGRSEDRADGGGSSKRFDWRRFGDGEVDDRSDTAVVRFDGDGLPDVYETGVVKTDPLDPDSDSRATDVNESDDGLPDGGEDFDDDRLITYAEYDLGTDPFANDSDGDGLPDRFEASIPTLLDPADADTNGDGIADGAEDFDGDGLPAAAEHANDTSIARPDSDGDGLSDAEEVLTHRTSPLDVDTDGDGLDDAEELRLDLDPLVADSDGDSVVDGNETYTTTAVDEETGVRISLSGSGDVASQVDVENVSQPPESDFLAAPVVRIQNHTGFENATVTLPVDGAESLANPGNFSVFKWSPDDDRPWHSVNSTVDIENGTASADVLSFSFFTVMDEAAWEEAITDTVSLAWPRHEAFSDLSGWDVDGDARVEDGHLVVSGPGSGGAVPDVVVAKDGSGDFEQIQPAVDAASDGQTLLVREGTYAETLTLDRSIRLVGDDVTLDGSGLGENAVGIELESGASVTIEGVSLQHYGVGVRAASTSADVLFAGVTLRSNGVGIDARQSSGDWTIRGVEVIGSEVDSIDARESTGRWSISNADFSHNGGGGLRAFQSAGDFDLSKVRSSDNVFFGIGAALSTGDWELSDVEISDNEWGGIGAGSSEGEWTIRRYRAEGNAGGGITAVSTAGDWTVSDAVIRGNTRGISTSSATGDWSVERVVLSGNDLAGLDAQRTGGSIAIAESRIHGNGETGIDGEDASRPIAASENWWGQASGPEPGQTSGNVETEPACTTPDCASVDSNVATPDPGDGGGATGRVSGRQSVVERTLSIPSGTQTATLYTRLRRMGTSESAAGLLLTAGTTEETIAEITSPADSFRTESVDLTGYDGETVTVEVVAQRGSEVAVDWIDIAIDTDGDGLRDVVENADLGMPSGPFPGASLAGLDPSNPDSDGDGIPDGEELTGVTFGSRVGGDVEYIPIRALHASADPTRENSDGGGLDDGDEVEAGSDPFVLETLVIGYTVPTMTEGPEDTLEDRNPMTVGEVNGLQAGGGRDSDLIAWPSRQYFDPLFCIRELSPGPGCSEAWMQGVEIRDEYFYVYVPFVVYAQSDVDLNEVPYEVILDPHWTANVVKEVNTSGTVEMRESQHGYVVYEFSEEEADFELQRLIFRPLGEIALNADLSETVFERPQSSSVGRGYSVSTSTTLPRTEQMLQDTQTVLEQGINVAFAAEAGYVVAIETGSAARGALAFLYHLAKSQISTPPTSVEDIAEKVSQKGITAFEEKVRETQGEIDEDVFGDGVVRTVGPTIIRQN